MSNFIAPDEIGMCNCAYCGCELIGEATQRKLDEGFQITAFLMRPFVALRINGRPHCKQCLDWLDQEKERRPHKPDHLKQQAQRVVRKPILDDGFPSRDQQIRAIEDAGE